ncbi:MAG: hypothetical protein AB7G28_26855 [Pirellulales bacterium]
MEETNTPLPPNERPRPGIPGEWVLVLVIFAVSTSSFLFSTIITNPGISWWLVVVVLIATLGALMIGGIMLRDYLQAKGATRSSDRDEGITTRRRISEPSVPSPFRVRLATFLHVPESEVLPARPRPVSSMPFWTSVPLSPRPIMMKSVEFIRDILERIHSAIRG